MRKLKSIIISVFKIETDKNRIYGLDLLRAFAIIFVMIGHGADMLTPAQKRDIFIVIPDGVNIFFVLSGFLIGGILIKLLEKDNLNYKYLFVFWQKRWLRTLPMYYTVLIILILLQGAFTSHFNLRETFPFFVFCQNLINWESSFFTISWSLSIEEWFYLTTPPIFIFVVVFCKLKPYNAILYSAIFIILFCTGFRFYRYIAQIVDSADMFDNCFRRPVLTRLDSLMFGVLGANFKHYKNPSWIKNKKLCFIAGIFLHILIKLSTDLFLSKSAFYYCNVSFIAEAIATLLVLPYLSHLSSGKGIFYHAITYISLISYSMYLLHAQIVLNWILPLIQNFSRHYFNSVVFNYSIYWIITIGISVITYKYIELHFIKFRKDKVL